MLYWSYLVEMGAYSGGLQALHCPELLGPEQISKTEKPSKRRFILVRPTSTSGCGTLLKVRG